MPTELRPSFACVEIHPQSRKVLVYVKVDPASVELEPGFTRDVSRIGHFGTGDLEIADHIFAHCIAGHLNF